MPAIYHVKVVDDSFDGAVQHIIEAQPNDAVVWHCEEADENFDGAIFHVKWAAANFDGPVWRVLGIARAITVVLKGTSPLSLPDAIADSLSYVKAFGGTEQRNLPDGYTQLEYLQSDGTQELRLPFLRTSGHTYKAEVDWEPVSYANSAGILSFGADYLGYQISTYTSNGNGIGFSTSNHILTSGRTQMTATMSSDGLIITLTNGTTTITHTRTSANYGYSPSIFGAWTNTRGFVKVYRFKFYEDDVLLFDLIPVTYNGTNSMYNKVDGSFLPVYAGTLIAGPTAVPTPDAPMDIVSNNGVLKARHPSGLPLGYTLLDGIINNSSTYVNTGIIPAVDDVEIEVRAKPTTGSWYLLQSRASAAAIWGISGSQTGSTILLVWGETGALCRSSITRNTTHTYYIKATLKNGNATLYVKDETDNTEDTVTNTYTSSVPTLPFWMFGNQSNDRVASGNTVCMARIKVGGVTVMDYMPVLNSSNDVGFYDKVSKTFVQESAGSLIAGDPVSDPVEIYADGTVETIAIKDDQSATVSSAVAETLLKISSDYQDQQEIIDGTVTRKVGVKVFNGTENWVAYGSSIPGLVYSDDAITNNLIGAPITSMVCSHLQIDKTTTVEEGGIRFQGNVTTNNVTSGRVYIKADSSWTLAQTTQWLADQYAAGTPVIVIYPLATPTTESVAGQTLQVTDGDNTLEITQASLAGLELEAQYQASVSLTIQEVQDANLDPNVEVTIN